MKIEQLPLYWRLAERGSPNIVPDRRPFGFDFIEPLQLVIQQRDADTLEMLEAIYRAEYNIGYLQDGNEIAKPYGRDFMAFIERALATWGTGGRRVLEVGCGGCTILEQLRDRGFDAIGVDPSPIAARDGVNKGIRVIQDFFPTPQFFDPVDLIFHSDVQEHVADPVSFLADQCGQLVEGGLVIVSLPDCNESVARGDLSMAMHQHLNYFDTESLRLTVQAAGLEVLVIEPARYGGSLYCCARKPAAGGAGLLPPAPAGRAKFEDFVGRVERNSRAIGSQIEAVLADPERRLGFYVPLRALPYLAATGRYGGVRFFDDTGPWYGRMFDGMDVVIENFADLQREPVTDLFVMSLTFGDVIASRLRREGVGVPRIALLRDMLLP